MWILLNTYLQFGDIQKKDGRRYADKKEINMKSQLKDGNFK